MLRRLSDARKIHKFGKMLGKKLECRKSGRKKISTLKNYKKTRHVEKLLGKNENVKNT